jgi:hypothetical protein
MRVADLTERDFIPMVAAVSSDKVDPVKINIFTMNLNSCIVVADRQGQRLVVADKINDIYDQLEAARNPLIVKLTDPRITTGAFGTQMTVVFNKQLFGAKPKSTLKVITVSDSDSDTSDSDTSDTSDSDTSDTSDSDTNSDDTTATTTTTTTEKKTQGTRINLKLFKNGNITMVGCRDLSDAQTSILTIQKSLPTLSVRFQPFIINNMNGNFHYKGAVDIKKIEAALTPLKRHHYIFATLNGNQSITLHYYIQPKVAGLAGLYKCLGVGGLISKTSIEQMLCYDPIPLEPCQKSRIIIVIYRSGFIEASGIRSDHMTARANLLINHLLQHQ